MMMNINLNEVDKDNKSKKINPRKSQKNPKERQLIKKTLNSLFSVLLKTKEIIHKGKRL